MTGRVEFYHTSSTSYYNTNPWFRGNRVIPQQSLLVNGVWFKAGATSSTTGVQPTIWRTSDQVQLGANTISSISRSYTAGTWYYLPFSAPVVMDAGVEYGVGVHGAVPPQVSPANTVHSHTAVGDTWSVQWVSEVVSSSTFNSFPNTTSLDREANIRIDAEEYTGLKSGITTGRWASLYYSSANTTFCSLVTVNADVLLRGLVIRSSTAYTNVSLTPVVFNSAGTLISSATAVAHTTAEGNLPKDILFTTPVLLQAGQQYKIGARQATGNAIGYYTPADAVNTVYSSSPSMATLTLNFAGNYNTSGGPITDNPTGTSANAMLPFGYLLQRTNVLPTAPTGLAVTNSPVPMGVQPNLSWTHNDPEADAQVKYQMRWRRA